MSKQQLPIVPSKKILLATDLSSRCDRAMDRASQLARQWDAELLIVHALEHTDNESMEPTVPVPSWRSSPDPTLAVQRQIHRDLREEVDKLSIHVERGKPCQVILDIADREKCDLIILGAERNVPLGGIFRESTIEQLVRRSPVSVLVVKGRPSGAYQHVLVGTDFTPESRYGLEIAAASFPHSKIMVMHAFEMPYLAMQSNPSLSQNFTEMEEAAIQEFIRDSQLSDQVRIRVRTTIEHGPPDLMLRRYVEEKHADLTVIGAYGRGFLFHLLVRGETPRIVDSVPSDVLLVRAHR